MKISMHASQPFVAHTPSLPESVTMVLAPAIVPVERETTPEPVLDEMSQGAGAKEKEWILQIALAVGLSPFGPSVFATWTLSLYPLLELEFIALGKLGRGSSGP